MKRLVKENSPRDKDKNKKNKRGERKTINKQTEPSRVERAEPRRATSHRTVPQQDETSRAEPSGAIKPIGHPMTHWQWSVKYTQKDAQYRLVPGDSSQYKREHNEKFMLDVMVSLFH